MADHVAAARPPTPGGTVSETVAAVLDADWNTTFEDWKSKRSDAECRDFHGNSFLLSPEETFCHICRVASATAVTEWSFYVYGDEDPPHCRLYQVRRIFLRTPERSSDPGSAELDAAISARLGAATHVDACASGENGCNGMSEFRRWKNADLEISVYRDRLSSEEAFEYCDSLSAPPGADDLVVLGRSAALLRARRANDEPLGPQSDVHSDADDVAAELGDRAARFRQLIDTDWTPETATRLQDDLRKELLALLDEVRQSKQPDRYMLMLAADVLAEKCAGLLEHDAADLPPGLSFEWNQLGGDMSYRHDLAQRVLREAPEDSVAHDLALLMMLELGLDPGVGCAEGDDQYRPVVRAATAFLSKRPDSKYRKEVTFLLAQAYETWWSASQAVDDPYVDAESAREGAEAAREHAVELYEQIVRTEPASWRAREARSALPRLKLRIDTNQRRFFCIYD